jgi:intraflagellar transport protein 56
MHRPGSALSKAKKGIPQQSVPNVARRESKMPRLHDYINERDFTGAMTLLELQRSAARDEKLLLWLAYAAFHAGEYKKSMEVYDELMRMPGYNKELHIYKACCFYALCQYDEAYEECRKGEESHLQVRLMFHIAQKRGDETALMSYHNKLGESTPDQLSLAGLHYLRSHFDEANDIYKKLLLDNREYHALNVYVAMCYYKLDFFEVSNEILSVYLNHDPTSVIAVNLKACNQFQLFNGKAAEQEFKTLQNAAESGNVFNDNDLLRHNLVVFRNGENALQVLPPLIDIIPEARLNLVIYYLRNEEVQEAFKLIKDVEPTVPREYILKGVVHAMLGQETENREHLRLAQQLFNLVGASASECDTIPGRQCMASCFFLLQQFEDVLVYLKSVKAYFPNEDDFNWNYGIASAAAGDYKEAEEALSLIQNERYKMDYIYLSWLCRCYIMNGKPSMAWSIYFNLENSNESFNLLQLIANDCYRMGHFYYSVKAFDVLERLDPDPEYWEGKRGAAIGVLQMVIAGKESKERIVEVVELLKNTSSPQVEYMIRIIQKWAKDNKVKLQ